jgi:GntR family transcriptional regulator
MSIAFNNRDPVYLQVVRYFKEEIATGRLRAGDEIPSRRELAAQLTINPNTVQKAYKEMEEQSLIVTEGNSPSRITSNVQVLSSVRKELIQEAVQTFVASIHKMNIPVEELLHIVKEEYTAGRSNEEQGGKP